MDRMKAFPAREAERPASEDQVAHGEEPRAHDDEPRPATALYDPFVKLCTPQFSDHDFDHF